jgi:diguanylate cyclase (GGDEF)-like protein
MRWGIGARLGVAFAAVAALAIAANFLAQHEIAVVSTTRLVPFAVAVPAAPTPVPVRPPAPVPAAPPPRSLDSDGLIAAIEQYQAAVRSQVVVHNEQSDNELADALQSLQRETQVFVLQGSGAVSPAQAQTLGERLAGYEAHGDELARAADERQSTLEKFSKCLETMETRTQAALDRAWKIFGRVITRQSLIDLKSTLDEIRLRFESLPATDDYDRGALTAVTASEAAFSARLQKSARDLAQSQGQSWVDQMRDDLAQLGVLQDHLIQTDVSRSASLEALRQETSGLAAWVRSAKSSRPPVPRAAPRAQPPSPATRVAPVLPPFASELPARAAISASLTEAAQISSESLGDHSMESTATSARKDGHAALIGWISVSVLLLMSLISIWTVASIVGPVRRLHAATRRIAAGEASVQVARGGIQELDDLAVSFNQMAEQLAGAQALARTYRDQLEAKVAQRTRELQHLAEHDPLTQLPNRRQLFTHLKAAIAQAESNGTFVGVFFLDLDNFKNINDSMGHAFGDRVLEAIAEQLRVTAGQTGFAARLGGDEFTVVCGGAVTEEDVRTIGWDLVRAFQRPVSVNGRDLMVGISVGASLYPDHGLDAESLLRAADAALFQAKALGRSQLTIFHPGLLEAASVKFSTEQGLRRAMERSEFELVFQPEISALSLETSLVEALLRWRLPDGRLASPTEFLGVAEQSGLIMEISDWVLRSAIRIASGWHHGAWPQARVAINLSSRQLLDGSFVKRVMDLLREHQLPPECIEIELTENVLQTGAGTIEVLRQLRANGLTIALDDFGTGYSSLASLERLPLTRVKLDRSLISSIHTSARSAAIARAIIGLCHNLGLAVTAEGIECSEQLALLVDHGPICLQGHLLARPTAADKLLATIAELPNHMQSLLLDIAPEAATTEPPQFSQPRLHVPSNY